MVVYIELLLSTCLATFFAGGLPLKRLFISVILAPYAMSEVVAVVIWKYMFEPEVGIITTILFKLGYMLWLGQVGEWCLSINDGYSLAIMEPTIDFAASAGEISLSRTFAMQLAPTSDSSMTLAVDPINSSILFWISITRRSF